MIVYEESEKKPAQENRMKAKKIFEEDKYSSLKVFDLWQEKKKATFISIYGEARPVYDAAGDVAWAVNGWDGDFVDRSEREKPVYCLQRKKRENIQWNWLPHLHSFIPVVYQRIKGFIESLIQIV